MTQKLRSIAVLTRRGFRLGALSMLEKMGDVALHLMRYGVDILDESLYPTFMIMERNSAGVIDWRVVSFMKRHYRRIGETFSIHRLFLKIFLIQSNDPKQTNMKIFCMSFLRCSTLMSKQETSP